MILISYTNIYFCIFTAALFLAMLLVQKTVKNTSAANGIKKSMLLIFSLVIIGTYHWKFCLVILAISLITYGAGLLMERCQDKKQRIKVAGAAVLCIILGFFKYFNYFSQGITNLLGLEGRPLQLLLPIGISFYTFSAIGYVADVANGKETCEKNYFDLLLFLAFFPKIVCGPIARSREFLPQLKQEQKISYARFERGIQIFLVGLFKKMVVGDSLLRFIQEIYEKHAAYSTPTVWLAAFGAFVQLYYDFSGYSDMAYGLSEVLGYELPRNFNLPFAAKNISEFWSRWHASLTSWLTEYVFNPLALYLRRKAGIFPKPRRRQLRKYATYAAILAAFFVSGIWHGVGLMFVAWGLSHGVLSVLHAIYAEWIQAHHPDFADHKPRAVCVLDVVLNFLSVVMIEAFFTNTTFAEGAAFFKSLFVYHPGLSHCSVWLIVAYVLMLTAILVAYVHMKKENLSQLEVYYPVLNLKTVRGLSIFLIFAGLTLILGYHGETFFAYGNF